jgi:hypothetical protein
MVDPISSQIREGRAINGPVGQNLRTSGIIAHGIREKRHNQREPAPVLWYGERWMQD